MSDRRTPLTIALVVLNVLLISFVVYLIVTGRSTDTAGGDEPSASVAAAQDDASQQPAEPSEPGEPSVTAPTDALVVAEFAAPSGNIWCSMTESSTACQIESVQEIDPAAPQCAGGVTGEIVQVSSEAAGYSCESVTGPPIGERVVLEYGTTSVVGDVMCTSTESGMTCTDLLSGVSVSLARAGVTFD